MSIFWYLGFFLLALAVLIVVHEFGHYSVARLCGVKVLRFAVGFGKPLFLRRFGADQTEWVICALPLGGYVKMLDEREAPVSESEIHRAFNRQTVGKRFAIVSAGPIANFLLAIIVYWAVFMTGVDELAPVVDQPPVTTAAASAGINRGDRVMQIGQTPVTTWQAMRLAILEQALGTTRTELHLQDLQGTPRVVLLDLSAVDRDHLEKDFLFDLGVVAERVQLPPVIGSLVPGGPADKAGIKSGDRLMDIDGQPIKHWGEVVAQVRKSAGRTLDIRINREGSEQQLQVAVPEILERGEKIGRIGIAPANTDQPGTKNLTRVSYGFLEAAGKSLGMTWDTTRLSLSVMWKMVTGDVSWRNLSGPVAIADYAGRTAAIGPDAYIRFIALVSISLGIVNLLPIPILDGGHLMYYLAEMVKGSPVSDRVMEIGQKVGFALLMMLMAFALYNDLHRLLAG